MKKQQKKEHVSREKVECLRAWLTKKRWECVEEAEHHDDADEFYGARDAFDEVLANLESILGCAEAEQ